MTAPTSVVREVTVPVSVEKAFAVFTARFDEVKPEGHTLLSVPLAGTTLEPRVGGAIVDRGVDGSECRWADIRVFEPPLRLVFSWNIGPDWKLVADPANASEVEVSFTALGPEQTLVRLEHRQLDRHGPGWENLPPDLGSGWPLYLARLEGLLVPV